MQPLLVRGRGLAKRFGEQHALRDVDFELRPGEFAALVGPSGCGKSTLLRLLAGLTPPSAGTLEFADGRPPRASFVFQSPTLLPWRSALDNAALPLELAGAARAARRAAAEEALALVGLKGADAHKPPRALSGGMQMRVSLARALAVRPELLLLDEPFAAVDELLREQLQEELLNLRKQSGWAALFVTHSVSEAVFLSERVLVMSARPGRVAAEFPVPFGAARGPELRGEPAFAQLRGAISACLRQQAR